MTGGGKPAALQVWVQALLAQRQELLEHLTEKAGLFSVEESLEVGQCGEHFEDETLLEQFLKQLGALQGPLEESARVCARLVEKTEAGLEEEVLALLKINHFLEDALVEVASLFAWVEKRMQDPAELELWRTLKPERFTREEKDWLTSGEYSTSQTVDYANKSLTRWIGRLGQPIPVPSDYWQVTLGALCVSAVLFFFTLGPILFLVFHFCFAQGSGKPLAQVQL